MLGEFTGENQADGSLDLARGQGALLVDASKAAGLGCRGGRDGMGVGERGGSSGGTIAAQNESSSSPLKLIMHTRKHSHLHKCYLSTHW
jgi:hypothetical protein